MDTSEQDRINNEGGPFRIEEGEEAEIERLKVKYRRLRIPPFVHSAPGQGDGLFEPETLHILQQGFHVHDTAPLAVLTANPDATVPQDKWKGKPGQGFHHPKTHWIEFCRLLRENPAANLVCEHHDQNIAELLDQNNVRQTTAYICPHGLIDFAYPVWIENQMVAVLFTGQRFVKEGPLWHSGMAKGKWFQSSGTDAIATSDLHAHSLGLIRSAETVYFGEGSQTLRLARDQDVQNNPHREVAPKEVDDYIRQFNDIGDRFTELAGYIIRDEKARLRRHHRMSIQSLLRLIIEHPDDDNVFHDHLIKVIRDLAEMYDFKYFAMFNHLPQTNQVKLLCSWNIDRAYPKDSRGAIWDEQDDNLADIFLNSNPGSGFRKISDLQDLNFIEPLRKLYGQRPESNIWTLFFHHLNYYDLAILIGKKGESFEQSGFLSFDYQSFQDIIWEIPKLSEAHHLMTQVIENEKREAQILVENANRERQILLEIAHDLRTPITSIVLKTQKLRSRPEVKDDLKKELKILSGMAQRMHRMSDRVWMIQDLQKGEYNETRERFKLEEVIRTSIIGSLEQADEKNLDFYIRRASDQIEGRDSRNVEKVTLNPKNIFEPPKGPTIFEDWPNVFLDKQLVSAVFSNLIDNAVKYSEPGREIRIDGRRTPSEQKISIVNYGLPILADEVDIIFNRGYRSDMAKSSVQQGSGLGLYLVKTIMELYGKVQVKPTPTPNPRLNVIEFILTFRMEI